MNHSVIMARSLVRDQDGETHDDIVTVEFFDEWRFEHRVSTATGEWLISEKQFVSRHGVFRITPQGV